MKLDHTGTTRLVADSAMTVKAPPPCVYRHSKQYNVYYIVEFIYTVFLIRDRLT